MTDPRVGEIEARLEPALVHAPYIRDWNGHLPEGLGFQEAMSSWLKAHAKAKRNPS